MGESLRTDDRGRPAKASPKAAYDLTPRRGRSENRGSYGLSLAGVDAEGEVLDVLVQSKRNRHAALKLMRKLLRKYAFVPERLVTDDLRSSPPSMFLGSNAGMSAGDGRTIERRIRISQPGGGSARCSGSRARVQPRNSCHRLPPSTTSSTSNVISPQPKRTASFALWRWTHGAPPWQQPEKP